MLEDLERAFGRFGDPCIGSDFREHHLVVMKGLFVTLWPQYQICDGIAANATKGKARGTDAPLGRATIMEAGSR